MKFTRRAFLLGAASAPAVFFAGKLGLRPGVPTLWGDFVHDDTEALQAFLDGKKVILTDNYEVYGDTLRSGRFILSGTLFIDAARTKRKLMLCQLQGRDMDWSVHRALIVSDGEVDLLRRQDLRITA